MKLKHFVMTFPFQVAVNAIVGATIIYLAYNAGIHVWISGEMPKLSFWQSICIYLIFGVLLGDYRFTIDSEKH
ncbi:hypothetical protein [Arsukibacterium sp.]|uniref:hypothetical protein n=1 Tax=Arsukibacterium sp. TaxID=1977258 RepID=UPI001BD5CEB4|nr:hypothetical protein [Arsukibacterium sp.]